MVDGVQAFFGADAEDLDEIAANVAGGMLIVGDVGSIVKNLWRAMGFSDKDPNWLEVTLSGAGLALELVPFVGEILDAPISLLRAVVTVVGDTPFLRSLVDWVFEIIRRGDVDEAADFAAVLRAIGTGSANIRQLDEVLKSTQLTRAATHVVGELGDDLGETFLKQIDEISVSSFPVGSIDGVARARRVTAVFAKLDDESMAFFKGLPADDLATAMQSIARVAGTTATPGQIRKILKSDVLFNSNYTRADILADMAKLTENADELMGVTRLFKLLSNPGANFARGRAYELIVARTLIDQGQYTVTCMSRFVPRLDDLGATDIDLVLKGPAGEVIFVQAKTTINSSTARLLREWLPKVNRYAEGTNPAPTKWLVASNPEDATPGIVRLDEDEIIDI